MALSGLDGGLDLLHQLSASSNDGARSMSLKVILLNTTGPSMVPQMKTKRLFSLRPHAWPLAKFPDVLKAPDDQPIN